MCVVFRQRILLGTHNPGKASLLNSFFARIVGSTGPSPPARSRRLVALFKFTPCLLLAIALRSEMATAAARPPPANFIDTDEEPVLELSRYINLAGKSGASSAAADLSGGELYTVSRQAQAGARGQAGAGAGGAGAGAGAEGRGAAPRNRPVVHSPAAWPQPARGSCCLTLQQRRGAGSGSALERSPAPRAPLSPRRQHTPPTRHRSARPCWRATQAPSSPSTWSL